MLLVITLLLLKSKSVSNQVTTGDIKQYSEIEPSVTKNKIVSPIIDKQFYSYKFTVILPEGWKLADSKFYQRSGKIYDYYINLKSMDEKYKLNITSSDFSPTYCLFSDDTQSNINSSSYVKFNSYIETTTSFGELRIAKLANNSISNEITYITCQNRPEDDSNLRINNTRIGQINLELPEDYNKKIFEEMIKIIENIQLEKI